MGRFGARTDPHSSHRAAATRAANKRRNARVKQESTVDLIGLIYDAALEPALWPDALERVRQAADASTATLFVPNLGEQRVACMLSGGLDDNAIEQYTRHFHRCDAWLQAGIHVPAGAVVRGTDVLPNDRLVKTEFYNDYLRPLDIYRLQAAVLEREGEMRTILSLHRSKRVEDFGVQEATLLKTLVPHFQRALGIARLVARCEAQTDVLNRISIGAFVLDQSGRIIVANQAAEEIASEGDGLQVTQRGFRAGTLSQTNALQRLVGGALLGGSSSESLTLTRASGRRALEVWATPLRRNGSVLQSAAAAAIVFVSDPERGGNISAEALARLYHLSPAQARVAANLAQGKRVKDIAEKFGLSEGTVRNEMKQVFQKTGVHRQSELVHVLLSGVLFSLTDSHRRR